MFAYFFTLSLHLFLFRVQESKCADWNGLKFCATPNFQSDRDQTSDLCDKVQTLTGKNITCVYSIDRLRCLQQLLANTADFGIFKAEDVYLAPIIANHNAGNLVVTNEFRQSSDQKHEFDMVVLVTNDVQINSLHDLRGTRLCHPGYDENGWEYDWSDIFSQYFEEMVVPQNCDPELNVFENKLKSSNSFFDVSCKSGTWSPDDAVDEKLKTRYSKLCASCQIPTTCSRNDLYWGRQGALTCLNDCHGDIAWARLQDFQTRFQSNSDFQCNDFSFLCPDGTKHTLNSTNPCVWLSRPWPVVMSRREVFQKVSSLMAHISTDNSTWVPGTWEYYLRELLSRSFQPIYATEPKGISPQEYLKAVPGFLEANELRPCTQTGGDKNILICTENEVAYEKCNLMALVARVYSIDPEFRCVLADNCLKKVAEQESDVVIVGTENLAKAYKEEQGLKIILYQTANHFTELRYSSAIVSSKSKIKRLKDLRGKKACFTKVGGLGWNSFLMVLKENALINDYCDDKSEILNFFSDVCIIDSKDDSGIRSCFEDDGVTESTGSLDLNEAQGLQCIVNGGGDVAFIDFNFINKYLSEHKNEAWTRDLSNDDFKSVCPRRNSSTRYNECYMSRASYGQVMVYENMSSNRVEEISTAFLTLSSLLANDISYSPMFKLFTHNDDEKNVLFESFASRLENVEQYSKRQLWPHNFNFYESRLPDMIKYCQRKPKTITNSAQPVLISNTVIIFLTLVTTINLIMYF